MNKNNSSVEKMCEDALKWVEYIANVCKKNCLDLNEVYNFYMEQIKILEKESEEQLKNPLYVLIQTDLDTYFEIVSQNGMTARERTMERYKFGGV